MEVRFPSTRAEAWERWQSFRPRAAEYAAWRNFVGREHERVSRLSPALRARLVTEEELLADLRGAHPFVRVEKFAQELVWRGYWKAWLEARPAVWSRYRCAVKQRRAALSPAQRERADAVARGESGVAVMDHVARELVQTGYLHNHARMWWAAFWIHVERLPWELGADFFFRHLLDADPASNTLSWRWVAGLQTPGKAYLVRRSNLEKYLDPALLNPDGFERLDDAVVSACPMEREPDDIPAVPAPWPDDPPPAALHRWGLWLHDEDLSPESCAFPADAPHAVCGWLEGEGPDASTPLRREFRRRALTDGIGRALAHWRLCPDRAVLAPAASWAQALAAWSQREQLDAIWTARPFVGPLADQLPEIARAVHAAGGKLVLVSRPWDEKLRPWAHRGYFPFWEKMRREIAW